MAYITHNAYFMIDAISHDDIIILYCHRDISSRYIILIYFYIIKKERFVSFFFFFQKPYLWLCSAVAISYHIIIKRIILLLLLYTYIIMLGAIVRCVCVCEWVSWRDNVNHWVNTGRHPMRQWRRRRRSDDGRGCGGSGVDDGWVSERGWAGGRATEMETALPARYQRLLWPDFPNALYLRGD